MVPYLNCTHVVGEAIFTRDETGGGVGGNDQEVEREVKVSADIVVGADGAGSKTRSILQELVRCVCSAVLLLNTQTTGFQTSAILQKMNAAHIHIGFNLLMILNLHTVQRLLLTSYV